MKRQLLSTTTSLLALATAAAFTLSACQTGKQAPASTGTAVAPSADGKSASSPPAPATPRPSFVGRPSGKSGSQLWTENCTRCHNDRSPATYNDAQWEVAMHHMRIRANLTAEEHTKILEFLQSAN